MKVDVLNEDEIKNKENKEKWRLFCEEFKDKVKDYNMGCLLRLDCKDEYTQENTMFSIRTQFLAIEIARNRLKLNDHFRFAKKKASQAAQ